MTSLSNKKYQLSTTSLFFLLSLLYCFFIQYIIQKSVYYEVFISLLFPLLAIPFFNKENLTSEIKRLLILETFFNLICITLKFNTFFKIEMLVFDLLFAVFFVFQSGGFLVSLLIKKTYYNLIPTIALTIGLFIYYFRCTGTILSPDNKILIYGYDAPLELQFIYCSWLIGVLLIDSNSLLPKATVLIVHLASFIVAFQSNEFFHSRMATACHLFVLNSIFVYKSQNWINKDFVSIDFLKTTLDKPKNYKVLSIIISISSVFFLMRLILI
ncbi:hypothetical protein V8245_09595 [Flavobacterium columnare]|uniref:hypothetical protein n=1 Tax=Flavobacterium columnare TaxID=996 RepID=UPI000D1BE50B|nr:hypothetical protein [Flavobacterium columnare]PTD15110.1 hypothetical protein C6N29_12090 [Flavobacterium columnare]